MIWLTVCGTVGLLVLGGSWVLSHWILVLHHVNSFGVSRLPVDFVKGGRLVLF